MKAAFHFLLASITLASLIGTGCSEEKKKQSPSEKNTETSDAKDRKKQSKSSDDDKASLTIDDIVGSTFVSCDENGDEDFALHSILIEENRSEKYSLEYERVYYEDKNCKSARKNDDPESGVHEVELKETSKGIEVCFSEKELEKLGEDDPKNSCQLLTLNSDDELLINGKNPKKRK